MKIASNSKWKGLGTFSSAALTLVTLVTLSLSALSPASAAASELRIFVVTASQFEFAPNALEANQGDHIRIVLHSVDVDHGLIIEGYDIEVLIPDSGESVTVEFVADRAGSFPLACSEYCGLGHADMRGTLLVRPAGSSEGGDPPEAAVAPASKLPDKGDPDFAVINLPTTLPVPHHKFAFWLTHRFARPLGNGSFGSLAEDLFGLDGGAQIGLGLRYGLAPKAQTAFYRTSDRTIQFYGQLDVFQQESLPLGVNVAASIEGQDNFSEEYSPAVMVILSRRFGDRASVFAVPSWVGNTNLQNVDSRDDDSSLVLGLGGRLRLSNSVYLVGEISPRLTGFKGRPGGQANTALASFGLEMRYGGHMFQINVSNDLGTTPAQVARGQRGPDDWFLGFNISRRFF
jgi:plastocyanin